MKYFTLSLKFLVKGHSRHTLRIGDLASFRKLDASIEMEITRDSCIRKQRVAKSRCNLTTFAESRDAIERSGQNTIHCKIADKNNVSI